MRIPQHFIFLALCGSLVLAGCTGSREPTRRGDLEREFQAEFGFAPSSRVTGLRCKIVSIGDTWGKWMLFTYDDSTVQRIVSEGFTNASPEALKHPWSASWSQDLTQPNPNAPEWWRSPGTNQVKIYYKQGHPKDVAGFMYLWIDDVSRAVYAKSAA